MSHSNIVFRRGPRIALRPLLREDVKKFLVWMNDPDVTRFLAAVYPLMKRAEEEWIDKLHQDLEHNLVLGVTLKGALIGATGLHHINYTDRTAVFGFCLGEKRKWGMGYGTEAMMLMLHYGFRSLNLRKINSETFSENYGSIACHKHCGFKQEGVLKEQRFRDGTYCDEIQFGLFEKDWLPTWQRFKKTGLI